MKVRNTQTLKIKGRTRDLNNLLFSSRLQPCIVQDLESCLPQLWKLPCKKKKVEKNEIVPVISPELAKNKTLNVISLMLHITLTEEHVMTKVISTESVSRGKTDMAQSKLAISWLLNIPATSKVFLRDRSAETILPAATLRSCRSHFLSNPGTAYWHWAA